MSTASVNKVILVGNLGRKPELKEVGTGQLAWFSLATSRAWADKSGEKKEVTTWHRVIVWGNQANTCAQYLDRGSQVFVEGSLEQREYTDNEGQLRRVTEIRARDVKFLGKSGAAAASSGQAPHVAQPQGSDKWERAKPQQSSYSGSEYGSPISDEDVPF